MLDRYRLGLTVGTEPEFYGSRPDTRARLAVRCGEASLTWAELGETVHTLARAWETLGIARGERVATVLRNRIEVVEIVYSLARVGIANATINSRYTAREVAETILLSDARTVVVDAALVDVLEQALEKLPDITPDRVYVVGEAAEHRFRRYEDLLALGDDKPIVREPHEDDLVWMAFTGGTTGTPKACLVPQRAWAQLWVAMCMEIGLGRRDTVLVCGSMNHAMGIEYGLAPLYAGGTLIILPEFTPAGAVAAIERDRVTFVPLVPSLFKMMIESPGFAERDTTSVRRLVSAGSPLTAATREQITTAFDRADFYCAYGSTETGYTTLLYPEHQESKPGSVGLPLHGMEVTAFDDDGIPCAAGEIGTIYKRGWNVGVEYHKDPVATDAAFRDDWHTVGDMGYFDEDGFLYLTDRRKNMIISGGINVYPAEVENVISGHPAVDEVAIIGVPDDVYGEAVCAVVVLRPGTEPDDKTIGSLEDFCRHNLANFKRPRRFEFRSELPKTFAGKLSHRELRQPFWAGQETRV